jgi:hypothetical protein
MFTILRVVLGALLLVLSSASAATATHGHPDRMVPIKGTVVSLLEGPDESAPGCPEGTAWTWRYNSEGAGQLSHLGRVTYEFSHCTNVPGDAIEEGMMTVTAANGDELVMAYAGGGFVFATDGPYVTWMIDWTIVEGTGRFEGATGSGEGHAVTYFPPFPDPYTELDLFGMIAYDASDRSAK